MMTLDEIFQDIHAMREDLLMFERKYGVTTEVFFEAYEHGEEPEPEWVLDWAEWAASYKILRKRQQEYDSAVRQLFANTTISSHLELIERAVRHESIAIPT